MRDDNCIFCKIVNGDIPSKMLYEDGEFKVILDLGPATKGHALILPKNHYRICMNCRMTWRLRLCFWQRKWHPK